MITNVYSVFDLKAQSVVSVFVSMNDESAERSFFDLLSTPNETVFSMHPGDFVLKKLGSFDESLQLIEPAKDLAFGSSYSSEALHQRALQRLERLRSFEGGVSRETSE